MKRTILLILYYLSAHGLFSQTVSQANTDFFLTEQSVLERFIPCPEGSQAENQLIEHLIATLDSIGVAYNRKKFSGSESYHSFSQYIDVTVPGTKNDSLFIIVPINTDADAREENDSLVNVALGLTLLEQAARSKPVITLRFIFLGAETGKSDEHPIGTRIFLNDFFPDHPSIFLYLNFKQIPERIRIQAAANGIVSPDWLLIGCSRAMQKTDLPFIIRGNKIQLFRMGFSDEKTRIEQYLKSNYPALCIEDEDGHLTRSGSKRWIASFLGFFQAFVTGLESGFPHEWDRHYLFFQLSNFVLIVGETMLLVIIVTILLAFIACLIIFSDFFKQLLAIFVSKWWSLLFFLPLTLCFSIVATYILRLLLFLKGNPDFWQRMPILFLLFKLFSIGVFYTAISPLIRTLSFPNKSNFYEKWAILFLLLNSFVFSLINVSFSYYHIWAFVFISLSMFFKKRSIKLVLYAISPFWFYKLIYDFFITVPEYGFCRAFLFNPFVGNVLLTLCLTPFILIGYSGILMFRPFIKIMFTSHRRRLIVFISIAAASFFTTAAFIPNYSKDHPQPVNVVNVIDMEKKSNSIVVQSPDALHGITIWDEFDYYSFFTFSHSYSIPKTYRDDLMNIESRIEPFLGRKNISLHIVPRGIPHRITCTFASTDAFVLYDSSYPFKAEDDGLSYTSLIGVNPVVPIDVQITVPRSLVVDCEISVEYTMFPFRFVATGYNKSIDSKLVVNNRFRVE